MPRKMLVNCSFGKDDAEKSTVAFIVASAATAADKETAVFLTCEGVWLATKGGADDVRADGHQPLKEFLDAFIEYKGQLWVCPACAKARGIGEKDLIASAQLAGAARVIGYLDDGATTLM